MCVIKNTAYMEHANSLDEQFSNFQCLREQTDKGLSASHDYNMNSTTISPSINIFNNIKNYTGSYLGSQSSVHKITEHISY
jgi:hypothetical protein